MTLVALRLMHWCGLLAPTQEAKDCARCPGPCSAPYGPDYLWDSQWVGVHPNVIIDADVAAGPFSVSVVVKSVAFLDAPHCPAHAGNRGGGGVSNVDLFFKKVLYELWAGERLVLEKAIPRYRREGPRHFSVGCSSWFRD